MKVEQRTVTLKAGLLATLFEATTSLAENKLPITATVATRNLREEVKTYLGVFQDTWNALLREYIPDGSITPDHPKYAEWQARATDILTEDVEMVLPVFSLEEALKYNIQLTGLQLDALLEYGVITK